MKVRVYREVKGCLFITASSEAGRSQQTVDPVGNPTVKYKVSLNDPTLSIINVDFSLFKKKELGQQAVLSSLVF